MTYKVEFVRIEESRKKGKEGTNARYYFGDELEMLTCRVCNELKEVAEMVKQNVAKDCVTHLCKDCKSKLNSTYRQDNPDYMKQYYQENPEYFQSIEGRLSNSTNLANQKANDFGQSEKLNSTEVKEKYEVQNGRCCYCLEHFDGVGRDGLTIDHIIPFTLGGRNVLENVVFSCLPCNVSKSNRDLHKWLEWKFGPSHKTDSLLYLNSIGVNTLI